ncbi:MAG TPA: DinB family protein [Candidatus Polarisedimenticolia bacterium]|nr:DinB family protein [Candidatus Polarisedimenticolia bacterium]
MRRLCLSLVVLALALIAGTAPAFGQAAQAYSFRERAVIELKNVQTEIVSLAQAMPAEKYTWRPMPGVRSVSEVYLHMAAANFGLTALAGAPPEPGFTFQGYEKSTTDKTKVIEQLNASFDYARNGIEKMSDADLLKPLKFQDQSTVGDMLVHIVAHAHEHLGQSIAYARMNGVVPPWTAAAEQRRQAARPPQK